MPSIETRLASRPTLIGFAVIATLGLTASAILGNDRHGALRVVADVAWNAFWLSAIAVIILGAATLQRAHKTSR